MKWVFFLILTVFLTSCTQLSPELVKTYDTFSVNYHYSQGSSSGRTTTLTALYEVEGGVITSCTGGFVIVGREGSSTTNDCTPELLEEYITAPKSYLSNESLNASGKGYGFAKWSYQIILP